MQDIIACQLSKGMGAEFMKFIRSKGLLIETAEYFPQLLAWVGEKIFFGSRNLEVILLREILKSELGIA